MNTILYDYVCDELNEVEKDGLKASNLDSTDKLVNIKKNLLKIEKYENEMDGGYSMGDGYWEAQGSYADGMDGNMRNYSGARRGEHWVRGHYSRDDGQRMTARDSYRRGSSYARRRDSRGRYSRDDAKENIMSKLGEMMPMADERQRDILENAMHQLENA